MMFRALCASVLMMVTLAGQAAPAFPSRPVSLVIPYPPGGPVDTFARAMAMKLSEAWGQPVVVETKPGASEMIGAQAVVRARPDGHTMFLSTDSALTLNPFLFKDMTYDPKRDLVPVSQLVNTPYVFLVPADAKADTLDAFIEQARQSPGALTFGTGGVWGVTQFAFADLVAETGIDVLVVPFSGLGTVLPELLAGRVDSTFGGVPAVEQFIHSGRLKALAVGGKTRSAGLPEVATLAELGYENVSAQFFSGLSVPKDTPPEIVQQIADDVRAVISAPDFKRDHIDAFALELVASSPEAFAIFLEENRQQWAQRVQRAGVQPQ